MAHLRLRLRLLHSVKSQQIARQLLAEGMGKAQACWFMEGTHFCVCLPASQLVSSLAASERLPALRQ